MFISKNNTYKILRDRFPTNIINLVYYRAFTFAFILKFTEQIVFNIKANKFLFYIIYK